MPELEAGVYTEPDLRLADLRGTDDSEAAAQAYLDRFKEETITPIGGRLCQFALIRLSETCNWFVCRFFHLVGDGLSMLRT